MAQNESRTSAVPAEPSPGLLTPETVAKTPEPEPTTLRGWAEKIGFNLGTVGPIEQIVGADNAFNSVIAREFNLLVIAHLFWGTRDDPYALRSDRDTLNALPIRWAENMLAFTQRKNLRVRGNHVVWGGGMWNPRWISEGNFSRSEATSILRDHIFRLMGLFRGRIHEWTVVNEPYWGQGANRDVWQRMIGADYIDIAFEAAREADPSATLIYNDTHNHEPGERADLNYRDVARLKSKGLVDTVGFQMHLDAAKPPNKELVRSNLRRFADLGVAIQISEFDVALQNLPPGREERFAVQARIYGEMLEALLETGGKSFTVWGIGDKYSWLQRPQFFGPGFGGAPDANPTAFDDDLNPKPAYFAMLDVLKQAAR